MNNFTKSLCNTAYTSNNAISNKSSLSACLDLFSMGVSSSDKQALVKAALLEDLPLAIKTIMYLRDPRDQGQGSKDIARAFHTIAMTALSLWLIYNIILYPLYYLIFNFKKVLNYIFDCKGN